MTTEKLKSGNYRVRVFIGEIDGVKKYKNFTGSDKKQLIKDAGAFEYSLRFNQRLSSDLTLNDAISNYIKSRENISSPSTIAGYLKLQKNYFKNIMNMNIGKLTNIAIQLEVNELSARLSPKTVANAYSLLHSTLEMFAPEFKLNIKLPKAQQTPIVIHTSTEVEKLLDASSGTDLEVAILLAALGSLRRSEICSLTSADVFDTFIRVVKADVYDKENKVITKSTKNHQYRDVPLPRFLIERLKQKEGKIYPWSPSTLTNQYIKLRDTLGIKINFHKLRHYYASVLHGLGVPDQYICKRGGWSSTTTLRKIYQHSMDENEAKVNSLTEDFFSNKFSK